MAEWRSLGGDEQAVLLEGLRAEFGQKQWAEAIEDVLAPLEPEYAAGRPEETRDNSLGSLAEMGLTVREVS